MKSIKHETDIAATKQMRRIYVLCPLYNVLARAVHLYADVPVFAINSRLFVYTFTENAVQVVPANIARVQCTMYAASQRRCTTAAVAVS